MVIGYWIELAVAEQRAVYEVPVDEEGALQGVYTTTLYAQHRVAPTTQLLNSFTSFTSFDIPHGDIHTSDIPHATIDDEHLAVVAVVGPTGKRRETHGHEGFHLDALAAHLLKETVGHTPAAHIVVDHTHLHALPCLGHKGIGDEAT